MTDYIDRRRTQRRLIPLLAGMLLLGMSFALLLSSSLGIEGSTIQDSLFLNVYLDPAGKALVTGYADNISGLGFLSSSEYQYENDTHRLYALTDGLTAKSSQLWTMNLDAEGFFEDYRITFYLPGDMRLGSINASSGLEYHLSAFNDSLVADVQGYEVWDPSISVQYQQPLAAGSPALPPRLPPGYPGADISLILLLVGAFILAMGSALGVILWRRRIHPLNSLIPRESDQAEAGQTMSNSISSRHEVSGDEFPASPDPSGDEGTAVVFPSAPSAGGEGAEALPSVSNPSHSSEVSLAGDRSSILPNAEDQAPASEGGEDLGEFGRIGEQPDADPDQATPKAADQPGSVEMGPKRIELSREMEAVIQTLTPREQAVITTLVEHGGRMTQAEIRYETKTPKSSLTGILISLERRKLVTKKEWGRTNIIELSEWFLSQRERS